MCISQTHKKINHYKTIFSKRQEFQTKTKRLPHRGKAGSTTYSAPKYTG
jgi:hypothetical protein